MSPVADEEFLVITEYRESESLYDLLDIILPNPEDPEGFQPLLFFD